MLGIGLILAALIGWAVWAGKLDIRQLPPVLLAIAGAALASKGQILVGLTAIGVSAAWYRGASLRFFTPAALTLEQAAIVKARHVLGVSANDDAEAIRNRHRHLIAQNHPDRGGSAAGASALNEARDLLLRDLLTKSG
jgi:hypothetical protein